MPSKVLDLREELGGQPHSKQSLRLWLRLLTCANAIEKSVRNRLRGEFGTTLPRFDVLAALEHSPDGLSMGELSAHLMVSNGNVTGIVARLEKEGMVARRTAPKDRRTHFVRLTKKGLAEFTDMATVHEGWIDQMFGALGDAEIASMMNLLDGLKASLATDKDREAR